MGPKKEGKKMKNRKKMMPVELKYEIIEKHEQGVRVSDLASQYGRGSSTICTVLKQKDYIRSIMLAKGVTVISKLRTALHENMEKMLLAWVTQKQLEGEILTQNIICEKARAIFSELQKQTPRSSTDKEASEESFKASRGWFDNFKKRTGIQTATKRDEAVDDYRKTISELIKAKGYVPRQVFNCYEMGLFWKRMPKRTCITKEEVNMSGFKPMKDRLSLALSANASGDCKIKPLLVYHSENPKAFRTHKILKEKLQVMWRTNPKASITRQFLVEWMNLVFGPSVKKYLQDNNLPMQALLVLDSSRSQSPSLEDDILDEFKFIKILFLASNTSVILDQLVITNFKKLYTKHLFRRCFEVTENTNLTLREFWRDHYNIVSCLRIIDQAWVDVTRRTLTFAWKKIWPEVVMTGDLEPEVPVEEVIVSLGKCMGLEVDERDVNELVEEHSQELTPEELQELQLEILREMASDDEDGDEENIPTSEIKDILRKWERVSRFIEKNHPEKVATGRAMEMFNDCCLTHFRNILKKREKLTSLNRFFFKRPKN